LEQALGQYQLYQAYLEVIAPTEKLYLAIDEETYSEQFRRLSFQRIVEKYELALLVVDTDKEEVVQWIS
jgi:threonine synthase